MGMPLCFMYKTWYHHRYTSRASNTGKEEPSLARPHFVALLTAITVWYYSATSGVGYGVLGSGPVGSAPSCPIRGPGSALLRPFVLPQSLLSARHTPYLPLSPVPAVSALSRPRSLRTLSVPPLASEPLVPSPSAPFARPPPFLYTSFSVYHRLNRFRKSFSRSCSLFPVFLDRFPCRRLPLAHLSRVASLHVSLPPSLRRSPLHLPCSSHLHLYSSRRKHLVCLHKAKITFRQVDPQSRLRFLASSHAYRTQLPIEDRLV